MEWLSHKYDSNLSFFDGKSSWPHLLYHTLPALLEVSILKLTNAHEQLCYNLLVNLLDKSGWPHQITGMSSGLKEDSVSTMICSGLWLSGVFPIETVRPVSTSTQRIIASFLQPADAVQNPRVHRPESPGLLLPTLRQHGSGRKTSGVL